SQPPNSTTAVWARSFSMPFAGISRFLGLPRKITRLADDALLSKRYAEHGSCPSGRLTSPRAPAAPGKHALRAAREGARRGSAQEPSGVACPSPGKGDV